MARGGHPEEALAGVDLFSGLTARELKEVASLAKEQQFGVGDTIAREGDKGGRFFLILEGEADVTTRGIPRNHLGPGDYFGEIALIDEEPRTATVVATSDLRALTLASFNFRPLLHDNASVANKILLEMCRRLRAAEATGEA